MAVSSNQKASACNDDPADLGPRLQDSAVAGSDYLCTTSNKNGGLDRLACPQRTQSNVNLS